MPAAAAAAELAWATEVQAPPCLSWRMTLRSRLMSLTLRADLGLKSHSLATRSHSVPGAISWVVDSNSRSADSEAARLEAWVLDSCSEWREYHSRSSCLAASFSAAVASSSRRSFSSRCLS